MSRSKVTKAVIQREQEFLERNKSKGCFKCPLKKALTVDHIIPQSILRNLNIDPKKTYDEDNLQVLCFACNMAKGQQLDFSNPKTKVLLLKYLAQME